MDRRNLLSIRWADSWRARKLRSANVLVFVFCPLGDNSLSGIGLRDALGLSFMNRAYLSRLFLLLGGGVATVAEDEDDVRTSGVLGSGRGERSAVSVWKSDSSFSYRTSISILTYFSERRLYSSPSCAYFSIYNGARLFSLSDTEGSLLIVAFRSTFSAVSCSNDSLNASYPSDQITRRVHSASLGPRSEAAVRTAAGPSRPAS